MVRDTTSKPTTRWRYVIALTPIVRLLGLAAFTLVIVSALESGGEVLENTGIVIGIAVVTVLSFLLTVALPYALYRDISRLEAVGVVPDWDPDRSTYVLAAAVGLFVPVLSLLVSSHYLYRRHVHVGLL